MRRIWKAVATFYHKTLSMFLERLRKAMKYVTFQPGIFQTWRGAEDDKMIYGIVIMQPHVRLKIYVC